MIDTETLLERMRQVIDQAEQVERANRETAFRESHAYDAGRVSGMKEIFDLVRRELR